MYEDFFAGYTASNPESANQLDDFVSVIKQLYDGCDFYDYDADTDASSLAAKNGANSMERWTGASRFAVISLLK